MNWMNNTVKNSWYFGFVLIIIAPIIFVIGYVNNNNLIMNCGFFLSSLGLACLGLSFAIDSSNKMKTIANANFLEALNDFEQTRVKFIGPSPRYSVQLFIWRSRTILERANEYDKHTIKPKHQKRLFHFFVVSLRELFARHTWNSLQARKQRDVIIMYSIAREYQREQEHWDELLELFVTHMSKRSDESEEEFFNRINI